MNLQEIENDNNILDNFIVINNNLKYIVQQNIKILEQNDLLANKLSNKDNIKIDKNTGLSQLPENCEIINQIETPVHSLVIPGLVLGRIIKQDFRYNYKKDNE
ncbi:TPA_asm: hypothetical protein [Bacopa monnieri virus 3]|nr:TPA_asm: hypothetical protein [Bacopa monnieri virus 3]